MKLVKNVTGEERATMFALVNNTPDGVTIDDMLVLQDLVQELKGSVQKVDKEYDFISMPPEDLELKDSDITVLMEKFKTAKWANIEGAIQANGLKEKLDNATEIEG